MTHSIKLDKYNYYTDAVAGFFKIKQTIFKIFKYMLKYIMPNFSKLCIYL